MTVAQVGITGQTPAVQIKSTNPEREKYLKLWENPDYRAVAPGEALAMEFLSQAKPRRDSEVIDFGAGTGRGALMLALMGAMKVQMLDFAPNCLDPEVRQACETQPERIKFMVCDLTKRVPVNAAYGYCTDVMEHIPREHVERVLRNVLGSAQHVFFGIATRPDIMGETIGEELHLTVEPLAWWVKQLTALGAVVHWTKEWDGECAIYCSAWLDAADVVKTGKINVDLEIVEAQTAENIRAGWMHAVPHNRQNREVILLAGGPSAANFLPLIRELRAGEDGKQGAALITVNGAYDWAIANGLKPSAQIVLDAREFNARFTRNVQPDCVYLISSQVHPKTLEGLPREKTYLWHSGISDANEQLVRERCGGHFFPVPGGSTVVLRAIPLLRMLGFAQLHVFGFDSCVLGDEHHAYEQIENDGEIVVPVTCGGQTFTCTPWMVSQATEFQDLIKFMGNEVELAVYGDGLIAQIVKTGAQLAAEAAKGN